MIGVVRHTIIAVICSAVVASSIYAKDANSPLHDRRIKGSDSQTSQLKTISGRVIKTEDDSLTIEQVNKEETVITMGPQTITNHNFHPGDRITATVTLQGRGVEVKKEGRPEP